jgi:hypothetical protein
MTLGLKAPLDVGPVPVGRRMIADIASAELSGRLTGHLAGTSSADWFTMTSGGLGLPDVLLGIEPDDGALVLFCNLGWIRFLREQAAVAIVAPTLETGDAQRLPLALDQPNRYGLARKSTSGPSLKWLG